MRWRSFVGEFDHFVVGFGVCMIPRVSPGAISVRPLRGQRVVSRQLRR